MRPSPDATVTLRQTDSLTSCSPLPAAARRCPPLPTAVWVYPSPLFRPSHKQMDCRHLWPSDRERWPLPSTWDGESAISLGRRPSLADPRISDILTEDKKPRPSQQKWPELICRIQRPYMTASGSEIKSQSCLNYKGPLRDIRSVACRVHERVAVQD